MYDSHLQRHRLKTTKFSTNTTTIFWLMFYALVGFMANEVKPQTKILLRVLLFPLNGHVG